MSFVKDAISGLVKPLAGIGEKHIERKQAKETLKAKAAMAKQEDATKVTLTDAEWENLKVKGEDNSWKDEYVTIIVTAPIVLIIAGAVYGAWSGDMKLLTGAVDAVKELNKADIPMGELMTAAVFAALGLKLWRSL